MRADLVRASTDLSAMPAPDLLDGSRGVFAANWNDVKREPSSTGNYLVVVRAYEPVIAMFIQERGWYLADTIHAGLEDKVAWWMDLPRGPR
jgi:hypothetical protein